VIPSLLLASDFGQAVVDSWRSRSQKVFQYEMPAAAMKEKLFRHCGIWRLTAFSTFSRRCKLIETNTLSCLSRRFSMCAASVRASGRHDSLPVFSIAAGNRGEHGRFFKPVDSN
jgi:hypothetical protein